MHNGEKCADNKRIGHVCSKLILCKLIRVIHYRKNCLQNDMMVQVMLHVCKEETSCKICWGVVIIIICIRYCYQILDFMGKATLDIFRQLDNWGMDLKGAIKMLKNKFKELQNCLCNLLVRYQEESISRNWSHWTEVKCMVLLVFWCGYLKKSQQYWQCQF